MAMAKDFAVKKINNKKMAIYKDRQNFFQRNSLLIGKLSWVTWCCMFSYQFIEALGK